ncbi:MAG: aminoglycoside phosphotransferase family protein [Verrucomicrobiales bacterium]|nr:aminoglycoside phosphotransferase family protein [Verrucomicrobiales bacterium]
MDRRFPIVEFEANRFRPFFGFEADHLEVTLLSGGACNSNYLVRTREREGFVCRIHSRGNAAIEKSITESVKDIIPVPEYLWIGKGVSVLTYINGRDFSPTRNLIREAGRIIGKMSQIPFPRSGKFTVDNGIADFEGWKSFKIGILNLLANASVEAHLTNETIAKLRRLLDNYCHLLDYFDHCRNLTHGDFGPGNILVSNDTIVGVLDWEFSHSGCSYMDIGNLLRHLSSEWEHDLSLGLEDEGFELPEDWRIRAYLIDLASQLEFLTSNRSVEFKQTCVAKIHNLLKIA